MKETLNRRWSSFNWFMSALMLTTVALLLPGLASAQKSVVPCPTNNVAPGCDCIPGDPGCPIFFYNISGAVTTPANVGVANISVQVKRGTAVVRTATTDGAGNFDAGGFRSNINYTITPVSCPSCTYTPQTWSTGPLSGDFFAAFTKQTRDRRADFDGDGKADISVFRPSNGTWYSTNSSNGAVVTSNFGLDGDVITPGDYDGDGKTDRSVFRPGTKVWYVQYSSGSGSTPPSLTGVLAGDFAFNPHIPVARDYDGDGKTDIALFVPANGNWHIYNSSNGSMRHETWGTVGDNPVPGDYDGDGLADLAIFRPSTGDWWVKFATGSTTVFHWGQAGDKPVQADYDGDCKTDFAVFRPSNATWYISNSSGGGTTLQYGLNTDQPVPGDYNGDGKADIAIYRGLSSGSQWWVSGTGVIGNFGVSTDITVPSGYIPQ